MSITRYLLGLSLIFGSTSVFAKDYACFVDPWDEKPENRINIIQSMGFFTVMNVGPDGKTFVSEPPPIEKILDVKHHSDRTIYLVPDGGFVVTQETDGEGRFLGLYAKAEHNDPGKFAKGVTYRCEVRVIERD